VTCDYVTGDSLKPGGKKARILQQPDFSGRANRLFSLFDFHILILDQANIWIIAGASSVAPSRTRRMRSAAVRFSCREIPKLGWPPARGDSGVNHSLRIYYPKDSLKASSA